MTTALASLVERADCKAPKSYDGGAVWDHLRDLIDLGVLEDHAAGERPYHPGFILAAAVEVTF